MSKYSDDDDDDVLIFVRQTWVELICDEDELKTLAVDTTNCIPMAVSK